MTKHYLRNAGKQWDKKSEKQLVNLTRKNTPTRVSGFKLGRSESSIRSKAAELGLSLKPTNQSPYNRKNKHK